MDTLYSASGGIDGGCIWGQGAAPVKTFSGSMGTSIYHRLYARSSPTSITQSPHQRELTHLDRQSGSFAGDVPGLLEEGC